MDVSDKYQDDMSDATKSMDIETVENKIILQHSKIKLESSTTDTGKTTPKPKQTSKRTQKHHSPSEIKHSSKEVFNKSAFEDGKDDDWDNDDMEEESGATLPDDLADYAAKFGIEEAKTDRFKLSVPHINLQYIVADEICLEGLDGITLEALWTRISIATKQPLPFPIYIYRYIWNIITSRRDIEFYNLAEPRGKLIPFDRYQNSDPDLGAALDPVEAPADIYPYHPVKEKDVLGSAISYHTRENITEEVRKLTLDEAESKYGSKLVMVGTQKGRLKVLMSSIADPKLELQPTQYCLLERIGRSRTQGEVTQGKTSLQIISRDPKILFYNRKILIKNKLISKQAFYMKTHPTHQTTGSLLHLTRFYNEKKTKTLIMTTQIVDVLRKRPFHRMEHTEAKKVFGNLRALKKLFKLQEFQKFVRTDVQVKYRELYPSASIKEWKQKATDKEKRIRTIELINPNINVAGSWNEDEPKEESSDEDDSKQLIYNSPILHQIYDYIRSGGPEGRSLKEIKYNKGMDFYSVRAAVNRLLEFNLVVGVKIDLGRQRIIKYQVLDSHQPEETVFKNPSVQPENELEEEAIGFLAELLDVAPEFLKPSPSITEIVDDAPKPEDTSYKGNYAVIQRIREQNRENKDRNIGYSSKGGESLHSQLLTQQEKLKLETTSEFSEDYVVDEPSYIKIIYPPQTNMDSSILEKIFKNQHEYQTAKNILSVKGEETSEKCDLKEVCREICQFAKSDNHPRGKNKRRKRNHKKMFAKLKQMSCIEQSGEKAPTADDVLQNFACPLKLSVEYTSLDKQYRKLCYKVLKVVEPILSHFKYKLKILVPKKRYMCKQNTTRDKLMRYSADHPLLTGNSVPLSSSRIEHSAAFDYLSLNPLQLKRNADPEENENVKRIRLDDSIINESPDAVQIFMGPKPTIAYQAVDEDNIETTVYVSTSPDKFEDSAYRYIKDSNATLRTLKRAGYIVEAVRQEKIISDVRRLHKLIETHDNEEGYNVKVDKKSIDRIYTRLVRSGHIKVVQIILKSTEVKRSITIICDPSVDINHSVMESVIEQMKMRFFVTAKKKDWDVTQIKAALPEKEVTPFDTSEITSSVGELKLLSVHDSPYAYNRNVGKSYGFAPKFMRMRLLHEFLFYLIYNHPEEEVANIDDMLNGLDVVLEEDIKEEMPRVYNKEIGWKMFVPPIPKHGGWPQGWALVCDILLRLPLCLFVKLYNVSFVIPELPAFLEHPIKQNYLVKHLPPDIRNGLLHRRKYIFSIHENFARLCYIGIIQFGPQKLREKDQLFIFLNRNTTLLNTTTSSAGYHYVEDKEYKKVEYHFATATDVETYWYEMWNICVHSKLGLRNTVTGTYITIEYVDTKPAMLEAMKSKTPEAAIRNDNGEVPGDRRGAAGLDSALWSHIKRNWMWSNQPIKSFSISSVPQSTTTEKKPKAKLNRGQKKKNVKSKKVPRAIKETNLLKPVTQSRRRIYKKKIFAGKKADFAGHTKQGRVLVRKVLPRADVKKKRDYDSIDKELMAHLKQSRSDWKENEERVLHICKIVSTFLCSNIRKQCIPYTVIRDVLHKLSPCSVNKTSGAVQRRLNVIFGPSDQQDFLVQVVKTMRQIPFVKKYFQKFYDNEGVNKNISDKHLHGIFVLLVVHFFKYQHEIQYIFDTIAYKYQIEITTRKVKPSPHKDKVSPKSLEAFVSNLNQLSSETNDSNGTMELVAYDCTELIDEGVKSNKLYSEASECPTTEADVILDTIKSIIHSTIGSRQEDISWIYQLFRVYQNYSDDLLKTALSDIRNSQMVSIKRAFMRRHTEVEGLPITTKLFQFSFYYCFTQITKFPPELFVEAHEILLGIAKYNEKLISSKGLPMECFEQGHAVGLAEIALNVKPYLNVDIPREALILNPNITDHTELIKELAIRYKNMLTLVKQGTYFKDDDENTENQFPRSSEESADQVDGARQEKSKVIPRTPMIQRFLKSWFLADGPDDMDDDVDESESGKDLVSSLNVNKEADESFKENKKLEESDKKVLSRGDKKRKRLNQITSEQSKKILESLNPNLYSERLELQHKTLEKPSLTISESNTQKKINFMTPFAGNDLSFEDYEKKLESLLSSKFETDESSNTMTLQTENLKDDEDNQDTKGDSLGLSDFSENDTNVLEKYLHSKRHSVYQICSSEDVVDSASMRQTYSEKQSNAGNEKTDKNPESTDADPITNAQIQYLMNDELTVEQIMEEMLVDCPPEERKVPKPINLARLLVKGLFPELDDDEERIERLHQHFVIICPDTNLVLSEIVENEEFNYLYMQHGQTCKRLLRKVQMDIIVSDNFSPNSEFISNLKNMGATDADLQIAEQLVDFVHKKRVLGASVKQLKENFAENLEGIKLSTLLNTAASANVLIRAGINYIVYVHHKYRKHWLVESCTLGDQDRLKLKETKTEESSDVDLPTLAKSLESYTEIKLRIMPWARIDGTVNMKVFEKWMCTALGYCLSDSMMPLMNLIRSCYFLKPADVYYLVECLQELGCVRMVVYKSEITLFSTPEYIEPVSADITDEFGDIYVETDNYAIIKLGTLLNKKMKEFDFPADEAKKHGTF